MSTRGSLELSREKVLAHRAGWATQPIRKTDRTQAGPFHSWRNPHEFGCARVGGTLRGLIGAEEEARLPQRIFLAC